VVRSGAGLGTLLCGAASQRWAATSSLSCTPVYCRCKNTKEIYRAVHE
jgi:hypothetical protein